MTTQTPLVSVIVNCYNSEDFLRETIDSILSQTYPYYEVIFWDNQSTDSTQSIIKSYDDERFKYYLSSEHTTLGQARNLAIECCSGEYITFLDSDDVWEDKFLSRGIRVLSTKKDTFSFYYSNYYEWLDGCVLKKHNCEENSGEKDFEQLLNRYMVGMSAAIIDVGIIRSCRIRFDSRYQLIEDYDFFLRLAYERNAFYDSMPLMKYRMHSNSLTATHKKGWSDEFMCLYHELIDNWLTDYQIVLYSNQLKWLKIRSVNASIEDSVSNNNRIEVLKKILVNIKLSPKLLIHLFFVFLPCPIYQRIIYLIRGNIYKTE